MTESGTCQARSNVPSPHDLPRADIVIYDGSCAYCCRQVERLVRWDGRDRLASLSLHDPLAAECCPDLTHDQLMEQMYVVTREGRRYGGAAAFRYLTRRLPRLWLLAPLLHIPFSLPLWQWVYRQVARRRYRLSQDAACGDTCDVHLR